MLVLGHRKTSSENRSFAGLMKALFRLDLRVDRYAGASFLR